MTTLPVLDLIGVPMDLGASRRGVATGPEALRQANLAPALETLATVKDHGNVPVPDRATLSKEAQAEHYMTQIAKVCSALADFTATSSSERRIPLTVGGDHSIAAGSVAGIRRTHPALGLLWLDAHGDINTPHSTLSGNVHGQPVAHLLGHGDARLFLAPPLDPQNIVLIGIRDLDAPERAHIKEWGVLTYTMADIDREGMATIMEKALAHLAHLENIHVSFDADILDPRLAPGVGTPVTGGLTFREAHLAFEMLYENLVAPGRLRGLDLVEVNPFLDDKNTTATVVVDLVTSLFGRRTL